MESTKSSHHPYSATNLDVKYTEGNNNPEDTSVCKLLLRSTR